MKININKDEASAREELQAVISAFTSEELAAAHVDVERLQNNYSHSTAWLQMRAYALPTMLDWYQKRTFVPPDLVRPNHEDILFAYIKCAVTRRVQEIQETRSGPIPRNLCNKTIEYILGLADHMAQLDTLSIPVDEVDSSPWSLFFGSHPNPVINQEVNLIRECAQDLIEQKDGAWQFTCTELPEAINGYIYLVVLTYIESRLSQEIEDEEECSEKSLDIFIQTLLEHPEGVWVNYSCEDNPFSMRYSCHDLIEEMKDSYKSSGPQMIR